MRINKRINLFWVVVLSALFIVMTGCKKDTIDSENPYLNQKELDEHDRVLGDTVDLDTFSIQWIQKHVFGPTCANSGCHDGLFEPDFRTASGAYNTLINRPPIKQDALDPLPARVVPGNADRSMLIRRLTEDLNGNSGIMPLAIEQDSDWPMKKDFYISVITKWINDGAKDMNGNSGDSLDIEPQFIGFSAFVNGNELPRASSKTPIPVPEGVSNLEIWFAYSDDNLSPLDLMNYSYAYSINVADFESITWNPLTKVSGGKTFTGYFGDQVTAYFKAVVDVSGYSSDDVIWFRSQISDNSNDVELPNDDMLFNLRLNATIRIQ